MYRYCSRIPIKFQFYTRQALNSIYLCFAEFPLKIHFFFNSGQFEICSLNFTKILVCYLFSLKSLFS